MTAAPIPIPAFVGPQGEVLTLVNETFRALNAANVRYCLWKSNEHLVAGLSGRTDLDVLVDVTVARRVEDILATLGFKRFDLITGRSIPGLIDYLGLDEPTGRLVHIHLHEHIPVGEKGFKSYRLPWEEPLLSTRQFEPMYGVYVADPHLELILLVVRAALRFRLRDLVRQRALSPGMHREWQWLWDRVQLNSLAARVTHLLGAELAEQFTRLPRARPTPLQMWKLHRMVRRNARKYRSAKSWRALVRTWSHDIAKARSALRARVRTPRPKTGRRRPAGGIIISLIGIDGAGKSTLARELVTWLGWKLDVISLYFGSGSGPISGWRAPLSAARRLRQRRERRSTNVGPERGVLLAQSDSSWRRLRSLSWRLLWAIAVAHEKYTRLGAARRARRAGIIVLCDRYPQAQVDGAADGPLLGRWLGSPSRRLRAVARHERSVYAAADRQPPDLVIRLHVPPGMAIDRKRGQLQRLLQRADHIGQLEYPETTQVVDMDASRPYQDVLREVKLAVWKAL